MEQKTFKVLFYAERARILKNGEAPIYLRITVNGFRAEQSLSRSVPIKKWDAQKGCAKGNGRNETELNHYLDAVKANLLKIHRQLEIDGEVITADFILGIYTGKINPQKSLIELFEAQNKKCRESITTGAITEKTYNDTKER